MPKRARPAAAPLSRTAILVRSHNPTAAALQRVVGHCASAASAGCAGFFVSVDATHSPGQRAAEQLQRELGRERVHVFTESDLVGAYPALARECSARVDEGSRGRWRGWCSGSAEHPASLAWGFHAEAINLWAQQQPAGAWDFCWVLEDDVGCSGDLGALLGAYAGARADLVTDRVTSVAFCSDSGRPLRASRRWCWAETGSDHFLHLVARSRRRKASEHVQRFSRALLDELHALATGLSQLARGHAVCAWSEMGVPTLCAIAGFETRELDARHVGATYSFSGRVSQARWARLQAGGGDPPQLFHALKW